MSAAPGRIAQSVPFALAITFAIQTIVALAVYCAPVMAPVAGPALGVSPAAVGYYIAASYFGSMMSSAAAGGWIARFGPIRVSQAGLALACAGLALAASAVPVLVMLGGFVVGLGYGPSTPASARPAQASASPAWLTRIGPKRAIQPPAAAELIMLPK